MSTETSKTDTTKLKKQKRLGNLSYIQINTIIFLSCITAFLLIGVSLAVFVNKYFYDVKVTQVRQHKLQVLSSEKAQEAANQVAELIKKNREQITYFIDQASIQLAIDANATEIFSDTNTQIVKNISGAVHSRFIGLGMAKLEPEAIPPIRYSELDMISRAEKGETVLPEAAKINNLWQITIVQAIKPSTDDTSAISGVFIVTFKLDDIQQQLESGINGFGALTLKQRFEGQKALEVINLGLSEFKYSVKLDENISQTAKINGTPWYIGFNPSHQLYELTKISTTNVFLIMAGIFASIVGTMIFIGYKTAALIIKKRPAPTQKSTAKSHNATTKVNATEPDVIVNSIYKNTNILDVDIREEDQELLPLEDIDANNNNNESILDIRDVYAENTENDVPEDIFRAYDIRGLAHKQITENTAIRIGQALGSEALDHREDTLIVAQDARTHSPKITKALIEGILSTGCHVLDIGVVPTPVMYFACEVSTKSHSGVIVTASHNAKEYTGFKIVMAGNSRSDADIKAIRTRILKDEPSQGKGTYNTLDIVPQYINTVFADVALAGDIHVVIDAGNGVTGECAPQLFEELGCKVTPLYCNLDGNFPNHDPDPTIETNLVDLIAKVKATKADLGVAFDGDGDRLMVVTSSGAIIWPDKLLMLFSKDILSRNPGADVVFDVKSTRHLSGLVTSYGGRPIMWKTGHSPMKEKMKETGALLGGEYSGHIFIKDRWYGFDDGMYAAARLIEIVSLQGESLDDMFKAFPKSLSTPEIRINMTDKKKFAFIERLKHEGTFDDGNITTMDGLRADFAKGWGLVRASNTSPQITLRFEADDAETLKNIKALFARELTKIDKSISTNWTKD